MGSNTRDASIFARTSKPEEPEVWYLGSSKGLLLIIFMFIRSKVAISKAHSSGIGYSNQQANENNFEVDKLLNF